MATKCSELCAVRYRGVCPGIDLVFYGDQRQLEFDFEAAAGADPSAIRLDFHGADDLYVDSNGDLVLVTSAGEIRQRKPHVYQQGVSVPSEYIRIGRFRVGFRVAAYDKTKPLRIDPVLVYSSFLGGNTAAQGGGELLTSFVSHISKYARANIALEIDLTDFENNLSARFKNTFGSAYIFGVNILLTMTRLHLGNTNSIHEGLNILLEDGHKNSKQAIEQISRWKRKPDTILGIISHGLGDKISNPILQAADLTAYAWWQARSGSSKDHRIFSSLSHGAVHLPAMFLPWSSRCIDAVKKGVELHRFLREQGLETRSFNEIALW